MTSSAEKFFSNPPFTQLKEGSLRMIGGRNPEYRVTLTISSTIKLLRSTCFPVPAGSEPELGCLSFLEEGINLQRCEEKSFNEPHLVQILPYCGVMLHALLLKL